MKKQFSMLALTLALVLVLTSCIPNPNPSQSGSTSTSETVVEYTVSFDLNGGIAGEDFVESLTVKHGETIALSTPTMENFTFVGWFDGEELYTEETPITKDVTLRAEWEAGNMISMSVPISTSRLPQVWRNECAVIFGSLMPIMRRRIFTICEIVGLLEKRKIRWYTIPLKS